MTLEAKIKALEYTNGCMSLNMRYNCTAERQYPWVYVFLYVANATYKARKQPVDSTASLNIIQCISNARCWRSLWPQQRLHWPALLTARSILIDVSMTKVWELKMHQEQFVPPSNFHFISKQVVTVTLKMRSRSKFSCFLKALDIRKLFVWELKVWL